VKVYANAYFRTAALPFYTSFMNFTAKSRLYLYGHGDWDQQELGGQSVENVALLVYAKGLAPKVPFLASIIGCSMARDLNSAHYGLLGNSVDSFAAKLHLLLGEKYQIYVNVFARVHDVGIVHPDEPAYGRKGVYLTEDEEAPLTPQVPQSKVLYTWESGKQFRQWVNYADKRFDDIK
jgi:hypothetical protein